MLEIVFVKPDALPRSGALVLPLAEAEGAAAAPPPGGLRQRAEEATGGAIGRALEAAAFKGRKGQTATVWAPGAGLSRVVAVGLGKAAELSAEAAEAAGAALQPAVANEAEAVVAAEHLPPALAVALAMGAVLRAYRFDRYRTKEQEEDKPKLRRLAIATADPDAARAAWAGQEAVAKGVYLARDLVSEPGNVLTPAEMAERCRQLEPLGVEVEILGPKEMRKLGFGALLGVAQGSANEPRTVVMRWLGRSGAGKGGSNGAAAAEKPLAFLGKGVTFDSGGISIKPAQSMEEMKWDMAGAGAVVGLMAALAGRKARADVVGLVGLVENMPSGTAQRPGDVVRSYSGQTIEVINTDAEGRLVLADLLWYCQEKYEPRFMVDLATLTGAIIISLGHEHAGLFSNDDELAQRILAAGKAVGENCWRMPLGEAYDKQLKSDIADMKNVGGRPAGSITAAQFLQRFVNGKPWAHLDIAGTAWASKEKGSTPKGASGFGVRLLERLVAEHYEG
ncbi:leucyl aminopeptidase [Caldovatus aquaticus]|uniref:Probable cytosol aminopeptidase n=1 Tax=Caldovatus aquaticus TaxID=2865671 RepID=A0ABS7EZB1_9PROT|nr:leucyl aminopeptidase [Caldovatus aquaticus]MBW8268072.1 leucyl aminopeptidase [Caldovatus aquaticus]